MVQSEGNMSLINPVTPPGIDPGTVRLVAQRLNHYATPGPTLHTHTHTHTHTRFATLGVYDAVEEESLYPFWESNPDIQIFQSLNLVTALTAAPQLLR